MHGHVLPPAALILVILIACGGSGERPSKSAEPPEAAGEYRPPPDLTQIDVCELLPPPEIPARFGQVTEGPTLTRNPNGWPSCSYVLAPNTGLVVELLESQWYDMHRDVWGPGGTQEVDGIGEKAYLVPLKPPSDPHLIAAKGYVAVKVTTRNLELAREAARTILAKL
jgi:hypothetical protein